MNRTYNQLVVDLKELRAQFHLTDFLMIADLVDHPRSTLEEQTMTDNVRILNDMEVNLPLELLKLLREEKAEAAFYRGTSSYTLGLIKEGRALLKWVKRWATKPFAAPIGNLAEELLKKRQLDEVSVQELHGFMQEHISADGVLAFDEKRPMLPEIVEVARSYLRVFELQSLAS